MNDRMSSMGIDSRAKAPEFKFPIIFLKCKLCCLIFRKPTVCSFKCKKFLYISFGKSTVCVCHLCTLPTEQVQILQLRPLFNESIQSYRTIQEKDNQYLHLPHNDDDSIDTIFIIIRISNN